MTLVTDNLDLEVALQRLQREHDTIGRLLSSLKSYRLEPKNYDCFVLLQDIRHNLTSLFWDQKFTIKHEPKTNDNRLLERLKILFTRFKQVEQQVASYLLRMGG